MRLLEEVYAVFAGESWQNAEWVQNSWVLKDKQAGKFSDDFGIPAELIQSEFTH